MSHLWGQNLATSKSEYQLQSYVWSVSVWEGSYLPPPLPKKKQKKTPWMNLWEAAYAAMMEGTIIIYVAMMGSTIPAYYDLPV